MYQQQLFHLYFSLNLFHQTWRLAFISSTYTPHTYSGGTGIRRTKGSEANLCRSCIIITIYPLCVGVGVGVSVRVGVRVGEMVEDVEVEARGRSIYRARTCVAAGDCEKAHFPSH